LRVSRAQLQSFEAAGQRRLRKTPEKTLEARYPEEEASKISAIADTANVDAQKSWAAVK
jgi:hypothetical protein